MCFSLVESLNRISVEMVDVSRMNIINTDGGKDEVYSGWKNTLWYCSLWVGLDAVNFQTVQWQLCTTTKIPTACTGTRLDWMNLPCTTA